MKKQLQLKIFPFVLTRIAGGSLPEFIDMNVRKSNILNRKIDILQKDIDTSKDYLSITLHKFIASVTEKNLRFSLIQYRRNIYNEKEIYSIPLEFKKVLPYSIQKLLTQYILKLQKKQQFLKEAEKTYDEELIKSKLIFHKLLKKVNFKNGLLLSSDTLIVSYKKYISIKNKPLPKIERSLIRYLSRMYTKPSPFSSFTSLVLASFSKDDLFESYKNNFKRKSHVELNRYLYFYLYALIVQNKELRHSLKISLNSNIKFSNNQYIYLANNFNEESIQHINTTPALKIIYTVLGENTYIYNKFVTYLHINHFKKTSIEEIERYINQLIEYGFIEFNLGISVFDNEWDKKLLKLIMPLCSRYSYIEKLHETLKFLRKTEKKYEKSPPNEREHILKNTYKIFRETCLELHKAAKLPQSERITFNDVYTSKEIKRKNNNKKNTLLTYEYPSSFELKQQSLWYEDTTVDATFKLSNNIKRKLDSLGNFLSHMGIFDSCTEKIYDLSDFFNDNYEVNEKIDFIQFYEDYYCKSNKKSKISQSVKKIRKIKKEYISELLSNIKWQFNNDDINITLSDVNHIPPITSFSSFAVFFQLIYKDNNEFQFVVNNTMNGFGKFYSRFLKIFSKELTNSLIENNKRIKNDSILAEITDASIFNADSHTRIMPYEISLLKNNSILPTSNQILLTEIEVRYDTSKNLIYLSHKKYNKVIYTFDLGFQNAKQRSEMYDFLSNFTSGPHHHIHYLIEQINQEIKKNKKNKQVIILPRIKFEDNIILQRKTWEIYKDAISLKYPNETDWNYFKKIDNWRKLNKIPNEIFIVIADEKPQYINFNNPLLLYLFENITNSMKNDSKIIIQEMKPNSNEITPIYGQKYISEFLAQWYIN